MSRLVMTALLVSSIGVAACGPTCRGRGTTRCNGEVAEVCDGDERWQQILDCEALGGEWTCGEVEGGHACIPRSETSGGESADIDGGAR